VSRKALQLLGMIVLVLAVGYLAYRAGFWAGVN